MPPLSIMIKPVSSACNMRCRYCFYADVAHNRECADMGRMSDATLDNVVRRALAYAEGQATFSFQGGEPTLAGYEFFEKLVALERKYNTKGVHVHNAVQTNGYRIDDRLLDLFARERFLVGVSYDGTPRLHDKYRLDAAGKGTSAQVRNTVKNLKSRGIDFNILCVVNADVAAHWKECFEVLSRFEYIQYISCLDGLNGEKSTYSLTPELYTDFLKGSFDLYYRAFMAGKPVSIRNFDNYISILLGYPPENCGMCGRCGLYYLIEADGSVYPCDFYVLDEWRMGNINTQSFFQLAKTPVGARFISASLQVPAQCRMCQWYPLCRNGCRRERDAVDENGVALNKWCASYRAFFEYSADRMTKMARIIKQRKQS